MDISDAERAIVAEGVTLFDTWNAVAETTPQHFPSLDTFIELVMKRLQEALERQVAERVLSGGSLTLEQTANLFEGSFEGVLAQMFLTGFRLGRTDTFEPTPCTEQHRTHNTGSTWPMN